MKKILNLFLFLQFAFTNAFTQMFTLPVYIHDAQGNKDTVYIIGDPTADSDLNSQFGEVDLNGVPYDSIFETRLTTNVFSSVRIETKRQALFYECPEIQGGLLQGYTLLLRTTNWPVTLKWDRKIVDSLSLCISESGISNDLAYFGGQGPKYKLRSRDSVTYSSQNLTTYFNSGLNNGKSAPIYAVAIGISGNPTTSIQNVSIQDVRALLIRETKSLVIKGGEDNTYNVEIIDIEGRILEHLMLTTNQHFDLSRLTQPILFVKVKDIRGNTFTVTRVANY